MKIENSSITMSASTMLVERHTKEESFRLGTGTEQPFLSFADIQKDILQLSEEGRAKLKQGTAPMQDVKATDETVLEISDKDKQKILALQKFIEALTGKKFKIYVPEKIKLKKDAPDLKLPTIGVQELLQRVGRSITYDSRETHYEQEKMSFASEGRIRTSDGREINFSMELRMQREFYSQSQITIRAGSAGIDPLVINFDGKAPGLSDSKFSFDLDSDGTSEQISFVRQGSGFLALDLNSDGIINNGKELFGPNTGSGFAELACYDSDGNNWIDENDAIYDKLRIWTKDADGTDRLFALGAKGVGAIYLGNIDTPFSLKDGQNNLNGQIQKTGLFVNENGSVGTIQHIDLVV